MDEVEMGSSLKGKLKSLCCSGGWCYGVFWRFDPRNPMLLTFEEAYYEEQMGPLVKDMLLQVHIQGEGVMGKVAKTGKHQWIFSDNCGYEIDLLSLIRSRDEFQDNFEFLPQFSCGIKTIAIISVKSQGVVVFGARQKILENEEFLDKTKKLSEEMANTDGLVSLDNIPASMNDEDYNLNEWIDSLISPGNLTTMDDSNSEALVRKASFSTSNTPLSPSALNLYDGGMTPVCIDQLIAAETETRLLSSGMPNTENPNAESPRSMWSGEGSMLTSFESRLPSEFWFDTITFSTTADTLANCGNRAENKQACSTSDLVDADKCIEDDSMGSKHSTTLVHATDSELLERATCETNFDFSMDISDFCVVDNLSECFVHSSVDCLDDVTMAIANDLPKAIGVTSDLHDGQQGSLATSAAECDLYEALGLNFESSRKVGQCWEEILMPAVSYDRSAISSSMSECISGLDAAPTAAPLKGLFSELGLEDPLERISNSNFFTNSNFEDQLSTTKRRRMDSLAANAKLQPVYNLDKTNTLLFKKEAFPKSQVGLWTNYSYSIDAKDNAIATTAKKCEEPLKATKKRARPGESTRPRPKDRQQIQDRLKELRGIIPNSRKCSIDSLLDLTVKHMHFLQSITQYADELKQIDTPKLISRGNGLVLKDNGKDGTSYCRDSTRAFDFSSQTMVCPIIVKDLSVGGHMLIEMLCEDKGFFLEIADIVRGFGLTILKGIMETRDDQIWAHFIVKTSKEVTGQVTRQDVFWSLLQLIQDTGTSGIDSTIQPSNTMDSVIPPFDGYQRSSLQLPISMADMLQ